MVTSWKARGVCVLSGVLLAASAAWGGQVKPPPRPYVADPAALEREAAAEAIVARDEGLQGRPFDPAYRARIKGALTSLSLEAMDSIPAGLSPSVLGDSAADLVFTPVAPCRVISFVTIAAGTSQNFFVANPPAPCGVPFGPATAVALNIIAVNGTGSGDLRVFPYGSPVPNASVVNYVAFPGLNIANGLDLPICNPAVSTCTRDITIQADAATVTVVADVYGYFAAPEVMFAVVNADGTLARGRNVVSTSREFVGSGSYHVIFNRDVTACSYLSTLGDPGTTIAYGFTDNRQLFGNVNGVFVDTWTQTGGVADLPFYVQVTCPLH